MEAEFEDLLGHDEVRAWLASQDLEIPSSREAEFFRLLDVDGSGKLSLDELVSGVARLKGPARNMDLSLLSIELRQMKEHMSQLVRAKIP
mmetsp:Transcript_33323/g.60408  ORF Transcript_33323/g.60408 Transcript_33323/m.60408 type:complete len:90 (-) Transcript_33323:22-291(-)